MESKIDKRQKIDNTVIPLLPVYFKKIGIAVLIISFLLLTIFKIIDIDMGNPQKEVMKYVSINILIFGMFLIAWARDKVEDDLTIAIRLKSIFMAFTSAVFIVVLNPLTDVLFGTPIADMKGQEVVGTMLTFYLLIYALQKKGGKMQDYRKGS